uniref:Uncharacterized protein n=1 Tax=Oryza brachyantha TaxID=4533 RepID=J3MQI1_ORYBR
MVRMTTAVTASSTAFLLRVITVHEWCHRCHLALAGGDRERDRMQERRDESYGVDLKSYSGQISKVFLEVDQFVKPWVFFCDELVKELTLGERLRVGDDAGEDLLVDPREREEAVVDGELDLADDVEAVTEEEVAVAVDAATEGVLDGEDDTVGDPELDGLDGDLKLVVGYNVVARVGLCRCRRLAVGPRELLAVDGASANAGKDECGVPRAVARVRGPIAPLPRKGSVVVYLPQGHLENLGDAAWSTSTVSLSTSFAAQCFIFLSPWLCVLLQLRPLTRLVNLFFKIQGVK